MPRGKPSSTITKQDLARIIRATDASILHTALTESVNASSTSKADINTLGRLLKSLQEAAATPLHCVRCHQEYFENENAADSCSIGHAEPHGDDWERAVVGYEQEMATLRCCGETIYPEGHPFELGRESNWDRGECIVERHTTDIEDVIDSENDNVETEARECGCFDWDNWDDKRMVRD